jgi:hypothetical protein
MLGVGYPEEEVEDKLPLCLITLRAVNTSAGVEV